MISQSCGGVGEPASTISYLKLDFYRCCVHEPVTAESDYSRTTLDIRGPPKSLYSETVGAYGVNS